jgi:hypothetical protein
MSSSPPYSDDASLFVSMIANLIPSKAYIYLWSALFAQLCK